MTEVLHSPSSSSSSSSSNNNDPFFQLEQEPEGGIARVTDCDVEGEEDGQVAKDQREKDREQLSLLALLLTLFRKSFWVACKAADSDEISGMEIGWPTDVRHVAHVTFDRFNGFLGLPAEFEPEVPRRAPSASATVFGVSTESMQLSYDNRGNSIPTILLLMQQRLYAQGGLQAEGIFRINADNSQEEYVRNQLNRGVIPDGIDVHCLSGLIKAWFRELPSGVLDSLSSEQVMQCQSEDDCSALVGLLPPTEAALLDWAINLMADIVQQEHFNKMNARNIAMVFAPNMTQMADPLTALMYAVQVMNFLRTLITKTLREREDTVIEPAPVLSLDPSDENGHHGASHLFLQDDSEEESEERDVEAINVEDPHKEGASDSYQAYQISDEEYLSSTSITEDISDEDGSCVTNDPLTSIVENIGETKIGQSSELNDYRTFEKMNEHQPIVQIVEPLDKSKGISNLSRIDSRTERIEAWR